MSKTNFQAEPTIQEIKIENKYYRVAALDLQSESKSYFHNNSWIAKQQGVDKSKNFNKNLQQTKKYERVVQKQTDEQETQKSENKPVIVKQIQPVLPKQMIIRQDTEEKKEQPQSQKADSKVVEEEETNESSNITHFLQLPVNHTDIVQKLSTFQKEFISCEQSLGKSQVSPAKAHITFLPLILDTEKKLQRAKAIMNNIQVRIKKNDVKKINLTLKGIGVFGAGPKKARVLYLKVAEGINDLQNVLSICIQEFIAAKLINENSQVLSHMKKVGDQWLLETPHITLFKSHNEKQTFDLSGLVQKYRQVYVGAYDFEKIELSSMTDFDTNGFYQQVSVVKLC